MIKYKDIIYSKEAPKLTNVLWVTPDKEGSKLMLFVDGEWQLVSASKEEIDEIKSNQMEANTKITELANRVGTLERYKYVSSRIAVPVVDAALFNLSMNTLSFKQGCSIMPTAEKAVITNSLANGNAIYYKRVPYIIVHSGISQMDGDEENGVPFVLKSADLWTKKHSTTDRPTYVSMFDVTLGAEDESGEKVKGKITITFNSIQEIEAEAGMNYMTITFTLND